MLTYKQAKKRHAMMRNAIRGAIDRGYSPEAAEAVTEAAWRGVVGTGDASGSPDILAIAVADTTPTEYSALLATEDIAAAFAASAIVEGMTQGDPYGRPTLPQTPHEARQAAYLGWAKFRELADQAGHLEHGSGADRSAAWPVFKAFQAKDVDQKKIRRIAEMAGRMYALLKGQKAKRAARVPEDVVGVELGGSFAALLPSELALLPHAITKRELMMRVAKQQALQIRREGKEKKGRGPLVIALDESGSMEWSGGDKEVWAKSVATALTRIAWEEKRPVRVVKFSTATKVVKLDPGDHQAMLRMQNMFLDGGTDIGVALDVAADEVEDMARTGVPGADVVLISDGGDAGASIGKALDKLDRYKTRLWSIAIECPFTGELKDRAAEYIFLREGKAEDVGSVAGAVVK